MRLPPRLVDLGLRLGVKPRLARLREPGPMRRRLDLFGRLRDGGRGGTEETLAVSGRPPVPALRLGSADGPALLYLHGGAYIAGSPASHAHLARALARAAGLTAVLADYRLAPEHPFPAAVEDAITAYAALAERGPVAVAGDSAGGGLAVAVLAACRAESLPLPLALALFSPWVDMTGRAPSHRANARSDAMLPAQRFADVVALVLQGADPEDPRASPLFAVLPAPPPPAFVSASTAELLLDDARALAARLEAAGGTVELEIRDRLPHAWPVFCGLLAAADRTVARAAAVLSRRGDVPSRQDR